MPALELQTERLLLRHWKPSDLIPFGEMNADPKVMQFFPSIMTKKESDELAEKIVKELQEKPYGLWALEVKKTKKFIGFVGLHEQTFKADFTPCIEIGWRIDHHYWRQGYAFESAKKVLEYAFNELKLKKVVSFTAKINIPSIKLMEKLGLKYQDEFNHPKIKENDRLCKHVFYAIQS